MKKFTYDYYYKYYYDLALEEYKSKIVQFKFMQNMLLGYLCSKRMLPNYYTLCEQENWGNPSLAKDISSYWSTFIINNYQDVNKNVVKKITHFDNEHIPHMDDFGSVLGTCALEGSLSLLYLYKYYSDKEVQHILQIFKGGLECVIMYSLENKFNHSRILDDELEIFKKQCSIISSTPIITTEIVQKCIKLQKKNILDLQI